MTSPARPSPPGAPRRRDPREWIPGQRLVGDDERFDDGDPDAPVIGVLALQGDVLEHLRALRRVEARPVRVRRPEDLERIDGLIIPGGESTTIGKLLDRFGLLEPLRQRITAGMPTFGTCAGLILLSKRLDQPREQPLLGVLDVVTRRNAFGRQVDSFDVALDIAGVDGGAVDVSFIRAPYIVDVGAGVDVLAEVDGHPVMVAQGPNLLAASFHPEIAGDDRVHRLFVERVRLARGASPERT